MNAIVTIAIGPNYEAIAKMTHPSIKAYADRIGAEFVVLDKVVVSQTSPHYEKFQIHELLNKYHRILYLDYQEEIKKWDGQYYNTGVMVISRIHKDIFKKPAQEVVNFYEQSYLNLRIIKDEYKVHSLDYTFNRMSCMDARTGEHRLKSHIVHYAGVLNGLTSLIPMDLARWKAGEHLKMRRNVVIGVGNNRLGDNVSSEPIARYIVENMKDCDFTIAAIYPDVFAHLADKATVVPFEKLKYAPDTPYFHINAAVDETDPIKSYVTCDTMNMTDFTSIAALRRTLPDNSKQPMLKVTPNGIAECISAADGPIHDRVLVHPGSGWPSKTFPKEWWNKVIAGLLASGEKVAIIGADTKQGQGTVDVDVPEGVVDTRNLLGVQGLIAACSMAKALVTNDSGPFHVASAFPNRIVLVPTCKHPDQIIPPERFRRGQRLSNAVAVYRKLTLGFDPLNPEARLEDVDGDITDYLPDPDKVVSLVLADSV